MPGVNLIPEDVRSEWRAKSWRTAFGAAAVIYAAALVIVFLNQRAGLKAMGLELKALEDSKARLISRGSKYAELQARYNEVRNAEADMEKRLGVLASLSETRISWARVLRRLSNEVPPGVWLKGLATSDEQAAKRIKLSAVALSNADISRFIFRLENSGMFSDVGLLYSQKREFDSAAVFDFEISAMLARTGAAYDR